MDNTPFTELDFFQVKENLKTFLKGQAQFKDYDFEGSNMNVLLDILSLNTHQNNVYNNMMFSEMFMDSTQLRENALSHAKELNYLPSSRQSSRAVLDVSLAVSDPANGPATVTIPKGTRFRSVCGTRTFTFITDRNRVVRRQSNFYRIFDLEVFEGREITEYYLVDNSAPAPYIINNENVDISSVKVEVRDNTNQNSAKNEFVAVNDIFGVQTTDRVFYIEPHFDNLYKISFGRDKFGQEPINGNVIEITYRVTVGDEGNGASNFSAIDTVDGYTVNMNNAQTAKAVNGAERESLEDIKFFAPKSIQIQERAVTESDYEVLLKQRFPNIQTISVYGGDQANPPQYGKVIVSVDVLGSEGAGSAEIVEYKRYLQDKTPLTIEPVFVEPEFLYVDITANISYDARLTTKTSDDIRDLVKTTITDFSDEVLNKFNTTMRQSRLTNRIDTSDPSILGTDLVARPVIEYVPVLRDVGNPTFEFGDTLTQPYILNEDIGFDSYSPAFSTSRFTMDGTDVTLQDDGQGNVIAVTASSSNKRIFKRDVGTIDYSSGIISLINFSVNAFDGAAIRFIANTSNKDVKSSKNRILVLRPDDITITTTAVR